MSYIPVLKRPSDEDLGNTLLVLPHFGSVWNKTNHARKLSATDFLRQIFKDGMVEVTTDERAVCLDENAVILAVLHDRALLAERVELVAALAALAGKRKEKRKLRYIPRSG